MTKEKIKIVTEAFAKEAKRIYGNKLECIILYGSCARGDFDADSDIDILLLMNVPKEKIAEERVKIFDMADRLDLQYEVVLTPILQSYDVYENYLPVSAFYQNVRREGVRIA